MILREFINLLPVAANRQEMRSWGESRPKPTFVCGREITDEDINLLSFGNYILLSGATDDKTLLKTIEKIFSLDLYNEDAERALGFLVWVARSVENINKRFAKVRIPPTEEERQAGVERLQFGYFGMVDWYARRMGINHDEAEETAWVRIYKCLEIETKTALYERRLMRVRANKQKAQAKSKRRK